MEVPIQRARFTNPARQEPSQWTTDALTPLINLTDAEQEVSRLAKSGKPQIVESFMQVTYQYWAPFNYPNIKVELGIAEGHNGEFNPDGVELAVPPKGAITIVEKEPIIEVTVIGSACIPPGFVLLQAEPLEWKYPRTGVKMKIDNLWGQHIRFDPWNQGQDEGWRDAGLSCADFHIPESSKITIMGGSQLEVDEWCVNKGIHDAHYCFRLIRITVKRQLK